MIRPMQEYSSSGEEKPDIVIAAYAGDSDRVKKMLDAGDDVNSSDLRDNLSLLHIACLQGDAQLVEVLLEHNRAHADLDFTAQSSYRPRYAWQFAANANHLELASRVHDEGLKFATATGPKLDI